MALSKMPPFSFNHVDQVDTPSDVYTADELKQKFDSRGNEIKAFLDALIDKLNSTTDGDSGADNIAATAIPDLDGATVQALLESIRNKLKSTTDGASGADFVAATGIAGLTGETVQALLESLKNYTDSELGNLRNYTDSELAIRDSNLNTHKISGDHDQRYYTKTELDPYLRTGDTS